MGRTWSAKKRSDLKDFERWLRKGATVYVINTPEHAGSAHLWNHAQTWSEHTCTGQHPLIGGWQIGANVSAKSFLQWHGTVYENPPRGIPHHSDPGPDCRDEGWGGLRRGEHLRGRLDSIELDRIDRMAQDAADRRDKRAAERGSNHGWF